MKFPTLRAILRLYAYLSVVSIVVLGATLGLAYRKGERTIRSLGGQLADRLALSVEGAEHVSLNGERFLFAVAITDQPTDEVLSVAERACAENSGNILEELTPALEHAQRHKPELMALQAEKLTTVRRDSKARAGSADSPTAGASGDVTCFTRPSNDGTSSDKPGFLARLEQFTDTLAMGNFGEAHYVRADHEPDIDQTRVLYVRSLGELKIASLFSSEGDVPGRDPDGVPRPPNSVRTFNAYVEKNGDGFYTYESPETPQSVLNFYDDNLSQAWEKMVLDDKAAPELALARAYAGTDRATYLVIEPRATDGSDVALIVLGHRGTARADAGR